MGDARSEDVRASGIIEMPKMKKRHTPAEIAVKLDEAAALAAQGRTQSQIAQALGVSVMTFHRWRKAKPPHPQSRPAGAPPLNTIVPVADLSQSQRQARVAELQLENTRLRKLVTDLLLEKMRLEEEANRSANRVTAKRTSR